MPQSRQGHRMIAYHPASWGIHLVIYMFGVFRQRIKVTYRIYFLSE